MTAVQDDDFITTRFPHERITMQCGEERVTASPTKAIYDWNGQRTAIELFEEKDIISKELFHHIYCVYGGGSYCNQVDQLDPSVILGNSCEFFLVSHYLPQSLQQKNPKK